MIAIVLALLVLAAILSALAIVAARPAGAMAEPPGELPRLGRLLIGAATVLITLGVLLALGSSPATPAR